MNSEFDDINWPQATTYSNQEIGIDNKPAYTNFVDIFDDSKNDAKFIWSSNVILDNQVIVRHTVGTKTEILNEHINNNTYKISTNPVKDYLKIIKNESMEKLITKISVHICVGIVLKGISELMFQYLGMHGGSNGRLCSTEIESGVPSIQYLQ